MRHRDNYQLRNWNDVYQAYTSRNIRQTFEDEVIDNTSIAEDLKLIEKYANSSFLSGNEYSQLRAQIEQIRYYPSDGTRYSFLDYIHEIAILLREGERLVGFEKSFKNNVFSNLGWFNQFLITLMLSRKYKVLRVEHRFKPRSQGKTFDCDVELEINGHIVHCQIKDIAEHHREERLEDIKFSIEHGMEYPDGHNRRKMAYKILDFKGSPPSTMPMEKWVDCGRKLNIKQRHFKITIGANEYGKHEAKIIEFQIKGFRRGSFTYSPKSDFNNQELLMRTFDDIEQRVMNSPRDVEHHFMLIANTSDIPRWEGEGLKEMRDNPLALMTVEVFGSSMISFTSLTATSNMLDIEKDFNKRVRKEWVHFF